MYNGVEEILREFVMLADLSDVQVATRLVLEAERFPDCELRRLAVEAGRRILSGCTNIEFIEVPIAPTSMQPFPSAGGRL